MSNFTGRPPNRRHTVTRSPVRPRTSLLARITGRAGKVLCLIFLATFAPVPGTLAQTQFGRILMMGRGPAEDNGHDLAWFQDQAEAGWPDAQHRLGYMYYFGIALPRDYPLAYKWFYLAALDGNTEAAGNRDIAASHMTAEEIATGQQLAKDWLAAHPRQ